MKIGEEDYSGAEVRIAACCSKDPVLINYINQPGSDLHKDWTSRVFMLDRPVVTKEMRQVIKSFFIFPLFYGSYFKSIASDIWEEIKDIAEYRFLIDHLGKKGLGSAQKFMHYIEDIEQDFWKIFSVFKKFQLDSIDRYRLVGGVRYFTGFQRNGYLKKNQIINTEFQGLAAQCIMWSQVRINRFIKENRLKSRMCGQIYDSIIFYIQPEEQDFLLSNAKRISCIDIRDEWKWIIVPLEADFEVAKIDRPWIEKKLVEVR
jgi:DNA polymerase I-like protein with 3'-5' exonuclease and polymerase domains